MTNAQKLTLELIRYEVNNIPVNSALLCKIDDKLLKELFDFSTKHDIGYIVGSALHRLNLLSGDAQAGFFNEQLASIYRYERIKYETDCIVELFEREKVDFILLKGAVIRELYPKPEMRMSCDLDILVHAEDIERAGELLKSELSFSYHSKCGHEINWVSPSDLKVELHNTLLERDYKQKNILDNVWMHAKTANDGSCQHLLTNEFFVFYHISHISKHFMNGGCGIRHFLDLWFIINKMPYDKEELYRLLEQANLTKFSEVVFSVSKMWFSKGQISELPEGVENYILDGGSYGSVENNIVLEREKTGNSKLNILFRRIFASRETLGNLYPAAEKYPVLIPYFAVARWCRIIFKDRMKKQSQMIKAIATVSTEEQDRISDLMKEIGLSDQNEKQPRN